MLIATLAFTAMQVLIKELSHFHVFQIVFFRSGITALLCIVYLKQKRISFIGVKQKYLILRSFFGIISMTLFFVTLQRMPLGASVSIKYLSPIFTAIFAVLLIKEKVKPIQWLFFVSALIGAFLLKGFDDRIDMLGLFMGTTGALFGGLVYVIIRKIGESEHPMVIVNYYMSSAAILSGLAMISFWKAPSNIEWLILLGIGSIGCIGQIYMTKAFQIEKASRVAQIKYMELIYSLIIGFIWFGESYTLFAFIGILLIFLSMVANVLVK